MIVVATMETFTGKIRDIAVQGMAVVDGPSGQVFFVRGGVPGDTARFRVVGSEKRYGFAVIEELIEVSPDRVEAPCPHHGHEDHHCQGCPWQMASYEAQLRWKDKAIAFMLQRNHLCDAATKVLNIHGSPLIFGYRNRAQFKTNGEKLGYVDAGKSMIDIEQCLTMNATVNHHLARLRQQLPNKDWQPGEGHDWNFFDIDDASGVSRMNRRLGFRQANDSQNEWMRHWIQQNVPEEGMLLELFCGSGNFTEVLANHKRQTMAIEAHQASIELLKQKHLPRTQAEAMDLFRMGPLNVLKKTAADAEILFLDPPRAGFKKLSLYAEALRNLRLIVYVSCDLSTFSYDAHMLIKQGWRLQTLQPVDQFPHTPHIECLSLFVRRS